MLALISV